MLTLKKSLHDERGVGVPTALVVTVVVFVLGATWAGLSVHSTERSTYERSEEQALDVAEAAVHQAMSALTLSPFYAGTSGSLPGRVGDYEVLVTAVNPADPTDLRRVITATGWSPSRSAEHPVARRLQADVELETIDGFDYALFAAPGDLRGANHLTVVGDVYSRSSITFRNNTNVQGDVVTPGSVSTSNNSVISGDIRAGGNVTLENAMTTVQGSVFSGGDVYVNARVEGDVQAKGTVTLGPAGWVGGAIAPQSAPPPVRVEGLPTFTWDPANYTPAPTTWASASAFYDAWRTATLSGQPFNGHHRITDTAPVNLDRKWKMSQDVTIVSDGPLTLSREISNAGSSTLTLVVISFSTSGITVTNDVTIPNSIRVLLFAPNGPVRFLNLKNFTGAVFGQSIQVDQNFTLTLTKLNPPGFTWGTASDVHYRVILRTLREVAP